MIKWLAQSEVGVTTRAVLKTGMLKGFRASSVPMLVRQRLKGATGPSLVYRMNANNRPDQEAVVFGKIRTTYRELDRRIDQLARGLRDRHGIGPGDGAVLVMRNRPEALEVSTAMSRLGGRAVLVSWRSTSAELEYLINHSGARAVFAETDLVDTVLATKATLSGVPDGNIIAVGEPRADVPFYEDLRQDGDAIRDVDDGGAVVIYTSGTTGKPKGAVRKFPREMQQAVLSFILETPIRTDDRHLVVLPMYHSTAFAFVGFTTAVGGTIVIAPKFEPEGFLELVERERITTTALVPTLLHRLADLPEDVVRRYDTRTLRAVFTGGAPLSGALARRFIDRFGHVLFNFYGATETGVNTLATPEELLQSPGTIGHVIPGNEVRLLDEEGRPVRDGETGELYVRNAWLVAGYHADDEATRKSMRDGFFSVGDLAHRDRYGLLHIDGRKRDMIISGGVNVYPAEVEEVLCGHEDVVEAAVIGVPDDEWGEKVRAFVVLRSGCDLPSEQLYAYCRERLSGPKAPKDVVFLDSLPKNPTGKVLKRELRQRD